MTRTRSLYCEINRQSCWRSLTIRWLNLNLSTTMLTWYLLLVRGNKHSIQLIMLKKIDLYCKIHYNTCITHRLNFLLILFFLAIGINISWEFSTTSNTHAERENLLRLVTLRNLFAMFYPIIQHKHILERFQRATKRGKFSRTAWEFDVVLNSRQQEILKQKLNQIYNIASIFTQF